MTANGSAEITGWCNRAAPRVQAYLAFSADGLSFRMPTAAECYLPSPDDSANPLVWYNNQTLWFNRIDAFADPNQVRKAPSWPRSWANFSLL